MKLLKKILLLPIRLIVLPVIVFLWIVDIIMKTAINLGSYIIGPFVLFILGCGIYTAVNHVWNQTILLAGIEAAVILLLMTYTVVLAGVEILKDGLWRFVCGHTYLSV